MDKESSGGGSVIPSRRSPGPAPHVGRREALTASGLGITSLMLPAASAAASSLAFVPSGYTYSAGDRTVAAWLPFDSGVAATYTANSDKGQAAFQITNDGLSAFVTQAGTTTSTGDASPDDPEISGATVESDPYSASAWMMRNSSSTLNLATAPHLRFSVTVNSGSLTLATLVLHSVRNMGGGAGGPVNLAAYVTAPGDSGATLRRTATLSVADSFRHIVINLGLSDRTFTSGTVTVQLFPYAMSEAREVRFARYDSDPAPQPLRTPQDSFDDRVLGTLQESSGSGTTNWMAAFIGTHT